MVLLILATEFLTHETYPEGSAVSLHHPDRSIAIILFDTTSPAIPGRPVAFDEFAAAYEARFGMPPGVYADTVYDATKLMALAIEQAGYEDATAISAALIDIAQNYPGVSGMITFDENGDRVSADFEVWKVVEEDGIYSYETIKVISL